MYYRYYLEALAMKTVSAREANQGFSELLARVERGEEVLITKRGMPVAVLTPYRLPAMTPERQAAITRAIELMEKGLPWPDGVGPFTRDEMHER
jgi:prevent-host-death family protein